MMRYCLACLVLLLCGAINAQNDYVMFIDNHEGLYLHDESIVEPINLEGVIATHTTLLDLIPQSITSPDVSYQLESLLLPNPFARPEVVISLEVVGAQDEFLFESENLNECTCGCLHQIRPLIDGPELSSAMSSLVGSAPPTHLQHTSLECEAVELDCDAACLEEALTAFAGSHGGEYRASAEGPMLGQLEAPDGAILDLAQGEEKEVAREIACMLVATQLQAPAVVNEGVDAFESETTSSSSSSPQRPPRQLLTGTLDSLEGVETKHGKDSTKAKTASKFIARALGQAKKVLKQTFGDKVFGQISFLGSKSGKGVEGPRRRHLLQEESNRDVDEWQSKAIMSMVGFSLVIITLMCTICMFSMEFQQDTLLYGKTKAE